MTKLINITTAITITENGMTQTKVLAIDEDGYAWELVGVDSSRRWHRLPELPVGQPIQKCTCVGTPASRQSCLEHGGKK